MKRKLIYDDALKRAYAEFSQGKWQMGLAMLTGYAGPNHLWARAEAYRELGFHASSHQEAIEFYRKTWQAWKDCALAEPEMFLQDPQSQWPTRSWAVSAYVKLLEQYIKLLDQRGWLSSKERSALEARKRESRKAIHSLGSIGSGAREAIERLRDVAVAEMAEKPEYFTPEARRRLIGYLAEMAEKPEHFAIDASSSMEGCSDQRPSAACFAMSPTLRAIRTIFHPSTSIPEGRDFALVQDQLAEYDSQSICYADGLEADWELEEDDLAEHLQEEDHGSRARAAAILGLRREVTDGTLCRLLQLLDDGRVVVRAMGLIALREHFHRRTLKPTLEAELLLRSQRMLRVDRSYLGRKAAAETLGWIGRASSPEEQALRTNLVEVLVEALKDSDKRVRIGAVEGLGFLGPDARATLPAIEQCQLEDSSRVETIRSAAIVRIEGKSEKAEDHRSKIVSSARFGSDSSTRKFALEALLDIPIERAVLERVIIEAVFLDDDRKIVEYAKEQATSLSAQEMVIRLGILDVPV